MDIKEMQKDILEHDLFEVVDRMPYGEYFLSIYNTEGDHVVIFIEDAEGSATWAMDREDFLSIRTTEELERLIDSVIYYNYIERDEEECTNE